MAEKLEGVADLRLFPRRGGSSSYPWETWASGDCWRLSRPADFDCTAEHFRRQVHSWAKRHGLTAATRLVPGEEKAAVDVQFFNGDGSFITGPGQP